MPAARPRLHVRDYTERLLRRLGLPKLVIATHWDVQTAPYGASQEEALAQAQTFVQEVNATSPESQVIVPLHFDTVHVDASGHAWKVEHGQA